MEKKYTKQSVIEILISKKKELESLGITALPKKSDFSDEEVAAVKSFLGPWPRALEAAGIKPERDDNFREKAKEKRIRAKRRQLEFKKNKQADN